MNTQRNEVRSNDGMRVPVWTSGRGRPLLIVHGSAGTHDTWEMMRAPLDNHFTVSIMDRRATSGDPLSPLEMKREFEDVAAVARSLDGDVAVMGHSSGALCALGAAPLIPNLRHLLLYEPPNIACIRLVGLSARFTSLLLTSGLYCPQAEFTIRPLAGNASR